MRASDVTWVDIPNFGDPDQQAGSAVFWSEAVRSLERLIQQIAPTNLPVLLVGECGTGKTFRARQIHQLSSRRNSPMASAISSSLTPQNVEKELQSNPVNGEWDKGTLFLKEITELSGAAQRTLLYSMPDPDSTAEIELRTPRLICSTAADLDQEVSSGRFRPDLYYRLNSVCLHLAPLRNHRADVPLLADQLIAKHASLQNRPRPRLDSEDYEALQGWNWPGNIRELENVARQIVILNDVKAILHELTASSKTNQNGKSRSQDAENHGVALKIAARAASRELEEQLILEALAKTRWNRKKAAQELQISYKSLLSKLKQMGGGKAV